MRSKGEGSLYKRGDGYWVGAVDLPTTDGIRRKKRVVRKTRNDALRALRELHKQIDAGQLLQAGTVKLALYLDEWLETVHKKRAKPTTFQDDKRVINNHVKPRIGGKRMDRLTAPQVRAMLDDIPTSRLRKQAYGLLKRALDTAVKDGLLTRNVALAVDKPNHKYKVHGAFTPDEALHIIRTAESYRDEMWAARWAAGFMTGLRECELLGLEWDRIDLANDLIHVEWQLREYVKVHGCGPAADGKYPCGRVRPGACPQARWDFPPEFEYRECEGNLLWTEPKTQRSERGVPIIAPLHIILKRLKAAGGPNPHNLVFHHPDGAPITQSRDQKEWRQLLEVAGVPHKPQHTIRRTAATLLRTAQVDEQTRMELFGHATADVQRIYAGTSLELQRAAMAKLADFLPLD